jgi:hypothetical protein
MTLIKNKFSKKLLSFITKSNLKTVTSIKDSIKVYTDNLEALIYESIEDGKIEILNTFDSDRIDATISANKISELYRLITNNTQSNGLIINSSDNNQGINSKNVINIIYSLLITEIISSNLIDGTKTNFSTSKPIYRNSTRVYKNGLRLIQNIDYTENNDSLGITFVSAPNINSSIVIDYLVLSN